MPYLRDPVVCGHPKVSGKGWRFVFVSAQATSAARTPHPACLFCVRRSRVIAVLHPKALIVVAPSS